MEEVVRFPEWLGAAVIGAVVAALGYVGKVLLDWISGIRLAKRERRAQLVELSSLLRVGKTLFIDQNSLVRRLCDKLAERLPQEANEYEGFEATMSGLYGHFTPEEAELHEIIRSTTINGMRAVNESILEWIRADTTYRTSRAKGLMGKLAKALHQLEVHLLCWRSKYAAWIPDKPQHALVYLGDQEKHGVAFPQEIDRTVERLLA